MTRQVVEWSNPPVTRRGGRGSLIGDMLPQLDKKRGHWAILRRYPRHQSPAAGYTVMRARVKFGRKYEFCMRRVGEEQLVYGRRKP